MLVSYPRFPTGITFNVLNRNDFAIFEVVFLETLTLYIHIFFSNFFFFSFYIKNNFADNFLFNIYNVTNYICIIQNK